MGALPAAFHPNGQDQKNGNILTGMHPSTINHLRSTIVCLSLLTYRSAPAGPVEPAASADPRLIYQRACQSCHGAEGQGKPGLYPPLAGVDWVTAPKPDRLIRIVLHGMAGPFSVNGRPFATPTPFMPGHAATLSDAEITNLLTWLRRSMGNDAAPVTPAAVAAIRSALPERKSMWSAADLLKFPDR